jgi:hypothetical protein
MYSAPRHNQVCRWAKLLNMIAQDATHGYNYLRRAVPTKPALHPQNVNAIHGVSTVSFTLPLALLPMYDRWPETDPISSLVITEISPQLWSELVWAENLSSQYRGKEFQSPYVRICLYILINSESNLVLPQATQSGPYFNRFLVISCVFVT